MLIAKVGPRPAVAVVLALLAVPVAATSHHQGSIDTALARAALLDLDARVASERAMSLAPIAARAQLKRLQLDPDDLLSATEVRDRVMQLKPDSGAIVGAKLKGLDFIPRGVEYDATTGLIAIAAVSQVLLYSPTNGDATMVAGVFDFANDVVFDGVGGLIVADQGVETNAEQPRDGALWRYDLESGEIERVAPKRKLSNPKLLARDKKGVVHFIDGGAGDLVSPVFDVRWDILYRLDGKKANRVSVVWDGTGIQATAYDIDSGGWHWIMNLGELVRVRGTKFQRPCVPPDPLLFATGLTVDDSGQAMVLDGADVLTKGRAIYAIDSQCVATLSTDRKLKGSRGLTHVPDE